MGLENLGWGRMWTRAVARDQGFLVTNVNPVLRVLRCPQCTHPRWTEGRVSGLFTEFQNRPLRLTEETERSLTEVFY